MINPQTISEQLMYATVRIEARDGDTITSTGSGFLYQENLGNDKHLPLVITNKHVIDGNSSAVFHMHVSDGNGLPTGKFIPAIVDNLATCVIGHPDPSVDLCAILVGNIHADATAKGISLFLKYLTSDLIYSDLQLSELSAVEDVLMVGYPIGLWDSANNFPIIRRGTTASHPAVDFQGKSITVIDAACFPGSSGSPVLVVNEGFYRNKSGTVVGDRAILLGVLASGPCMTASGQVTIVDIPTKQAAIASTQIMIHLGNIVKAKEIVKLVSTVRAILNV
ncbi:hypothetical protein D3C72_175780 [compost metagenome]